MVAGQILTDVYTERGERIRIIPAWRAARHEQDYYYRQNARDGVLVRVKPDGPEEVMPVEPLALRGVIPTRVPSRRMSWRRRNEFPRARTLRRRSG